MAGTVDLVQRCYTGLETRQDVLWLNPPACPRSWTTSTSKSATGALGINLHITQLLQVRVAVSDAAPVRIGVKGEVAELAPGSAREFPC
jgi:trehalose/maltose hydrolase-like predicted phosphorylase